MARTSFEGPVYSGGKPVVTQDQSTGELVGQIPIVYPAVAGAVTQDPLTHALTAAFPIAYPPAALALEGVFRSTVFQDGGPVIATPRTVTFGPGGTSATGVVSVGADGVITALKTVAVIASVRLRTQRTGAAGVSVIVIWGELSVDGGVNWTVLPNISAINLTNADETTIFYDAIPVPLVTGNKYRIRFGRSAAGNNSGDLVPQVLPGGLSFLGTIPSASLAITRFA